MRVNIIETNNVDDSVVLNTIFDKSIRSENYLNYLENTFNSFYNKLKSAGSYLLDISYNMFNKTRNNELLNKVKEILSLTDKTLNENIITYDDFINFNNPSMKAKEYMMSLPELYEMYKKNRLQAYEEKWYDDSPGIEPEWRDKYLEAIDGVGMFEENDEAMTFTFTSGQEISDKDSLNYVETFIVHDMWEQALISLEKGIDPTDKDLGEL